MWKDINSEKLKVGVDTDVSRKPLFFNDALSILERGQHVHSGRFHVAPTPNVLFESLKNLEWIAPDSGSIELWQQTSYHLI